MFLSQNAKPFLTSLKQHFASIPLENFGRMNTRLQAEKVQAQVEDALTRGAKVLAERKIEGSNPFALGPRILVDVPNDCLLMREETFGPVLPVIFYQDLSEVLRELNASPFGLTTSLWSSDYERAERLANSIDSSVVTINDHMNTPGFPEAPWLGRKSSGLGFTKSAMALRNFSKMKYVYHDRGWIAYKFWQYSVFRRKTPLDPSIPGFAIRRSHHRQGCFHRKSPAAAALQPLGENRKNLTQRGCPKGTLPSIHMWHLQPGRIVVLQGRTIGKCRVVVQCPQ